ncbi:MAG: heavy metal translocating P-type ATPase [Desulfovibrio sp.]|nr:heavy metal translocating P-type ATPase [Desulfovibrio sp.]
MAMQKFSVYGMSCAACSARVEKAVREIQGVTSCAVSLLTNSMGVEGDVPEDVIIKAVTDAGYRAEVAGNAKPSTTGAGDTARLDIQHLEKRLFWSVILLLPLLYLSMGHMLFSWPLPSMLSANPGGLALTELLLAALVMVINQKFFINGVRGFLNKAPNMDTLVALGSLASFGWSTVVLFDMMNFLAKGNAGEVSRCLTDMYFETAAMIVTLITVGKLLEARSKGKTTDALKGLMKLSPQKAILEKNGVEEEVPVARVQVGDVFLVRPGDNIPVDGVVIDGTSAVNEAALTGESIPVDKVSGQHVSQATTNISGFLRCRATRVGEDTTLSQIIRMVSDAQATKAPIAKLADTVAGIFVPCVLLIALVTTIIWILTGESMGFSLARGIAVLVISCPCALGLATPVAIMVGSGVGARHGILFKTAVALEESGRTKIVALDKTGTLTEGKPVVTDILPADDGTSERLLSFAYSLERFSEHPLAGAIVEEGKKQNVQKRDLGGFQAIPGQGLLAKCAEGIVCGGNRDFITKKAHIAPDLLNRAKTCAESGKTPLFFSLGSVCLGVIAVADTLKKDSKDAVAQLKDLGLSVVMLTGDNEKTAMAIGEQAGVDTVYAGILPNEKEAIIRTLKKSGSTAMVGDGINDAPALTRADSGIAIGAGTDIAIDAAGIVIVKSRLTDVCAAIRLSRATLKTIRENLFWAFFYNVLGIPLAAGLLYPFFGIVLSPIIGAAAMSLSSFCVVSNALRLNFFDPFAVRKHKKHLSKHPVAGVPEHGTLTAEETSGISGTRTLSVSGMMCENCEGHVQKALLSINGIEEAVANHKEGLVRIRVSGEVPEEEIRERLLKEDYVFEGYADSTLVSKNNDTRLLSVSGMMCENCEAHVQKALLSIKGIEEALANHKKGLVSIRVSGTISEEDIKRVLQEEDYVFEGYAEKKSR